MQRSLKAQEEKEQRHRSVGLAAATAQTRLTIAATASTTVQNSQSEKTDLYSKSDGKGKQASGEVGLDCHTANIVDGRDCGIHGRREPRTRNCGSCLC